MDGLHASFVFNGTVSGRRNGIDKEPDPTLSNQRCTGSRSMDQPRDLSTAQIVQHNPVIMLHPMYFHYNNYYYYK